MSNNNGNKISINLEWVAIVLLLVLFHGEPDIVDGIVFKLTGVTNW